MSKKSPLVVLVRSGGEIIGRLTTTEFMDYMRTIEPANLFLSDYVDRFNAGKAQAGEPERVEVVLTK